VVFVRKVPTASGATAVQIAERVGDRDNVIEHVGSARTPAELVALLEVARARMWFPPNRGGCLLGGCSRGEGSVFVVDG